MADYFKLRLLLNRTNLVRDQRTQITFEIYKKEDSDFRLIASLKGIKNPKHIELCKTSGRQVWEASEYSGLFYLEAFCAAYLRQHFQFTHPLEAFQALAKNLQTELQSLGISR